MRFHDMRYHFMKIHYPILPSFQRLLWVLLFAFLFLLASCNKDGTGIYYQISKEKAQDSSEISDLSIHQVVEVDTDIYARAGLSVWKQAGSDWVKVSGNNYVYGIVPSGTTLYGNINNDINNYTEGQIRLFDGTSFASTAVFTYPGTIAVLQVEHEEAYILKLDTMQLDTPGLEEVRVTSNFLTFTSQIVVAFLDAAKLGGTYYGISKDTLYSDVMSTTPSVALAPTFDPAVSGDFRALCTDNEASEHIYLTTSAGQVYQSTDASSWSLLADIADEPVVGSMDIVTIESNKYLIIGTNNGYYEMEVGTSSVTGPTVTADTAGPAEFAAKYPELAIALVHDVYTAPSDGTLYLATEFGLWKRNTDGSFSRQ
jgi:hypothetical protein